VILEKTVSEVTPEIARLVDGGFVSINEAAELLSVGVKTIERAMKKKELVYTRLRPGGVRIPRIALQQFASQYMQNLPGYVPPEESDTPEPPRKRKRRIRTA
jgi:excisionase family DNA binding protein